MKASINFQDDNPSLATGFTPVDRVVCRRSNNHRDYVSPVSLGMKAQQDGV